MWKKPERPVHWENQAIYFPKPCGGGKVDNPENYLAFHRRVKDCT